VQTGTLEVASDISGISYRDDGGGIFRYNMAAGKILVFPARQILWAGRKRGGSDFQKSNVNIPQKFATVCPPPLVYLVRRRAG
jgi:hypothetical protein